MIWSNVYESFFIVTTSVFIDMNEIIKNKNQLGTYYNIGNGTSFHLDLCAYGPDQGWIESLVVSESRV